MTKNYLLSLLLLFPLLADSQDSGGSNAIRERASCPVLDTSFFHEINMVFQKEVLKRGSLDPATLRFLYGIGKQLATEAHYPQGLIQMNLGLGAGYLVKTEIDSAKHYNSIAICEADILHDTILLAKGHLGLGWALVYDDSDYEGAMYHVKKANVLVHAVRNPTYIVFMATRLVRLYSLMNDFLNGYKACSELVRLAELYKDTTQLVDSYYMLAGFYDELDLYHWQMQMVEKSLALQPFVKDSQGLYKINLTASSGYLNKKDFSKAMQYARVNVPFAKAIFRYTHAMENLAMVHYEMRNLDSARFYFQASMNQSLSEDTYVDTYIYLRLGQIEFMSGNHEKAHEYFMVAKKMITKPALHTQLEIYKALYDFYNARGDNQAALQNLKMQTLIADSISTFRVATSVLTAESQKLFDQIYILKQDNELKEARAVQVKQKESMMLGSAGVISVFALLAFIRFRRHKIAKNRQALLNERLRISRELHDEVGSTLSGIAMYSHVAREQVKNSDNIHAEQSLTIMQKSAGDMVSKLGDIVWLINPQQDTISELFQRLEEYARQMTSAQNMQVVIDLPEDLSSVHIPLEARRNIYLFCKEAINNAAKYSQGTRIELQAKVEKGYIRFIVKDDGKGFDEISVRRGNGLQNMKHRAEEIGATFKIGSRPQQGSKIEMLYKLTH